jgi:hypothetical protein
MTEQTNWLAVPVLVVACLVYAAFGTSVGLWFSLKCRTTLRAMFCTLVVLIVTCGGHQVVTWFIGPLVSDQIPVMQGGSAFLKPPWFKRLDEFQSYGLTPPTTLYHLASSKDIVESLHPINLTRLGDCVLGLGVYAACATLLLLAVFNWFDRATGRVSEARRMKPALSPNQMRQLSPSGR